MAATIRAATVSPASANSFEPFAEAIRVELLVAARLSAPPQIEVEDRRQLRWCCRGDELSAGVESAVPNELMQRLWRKMRHESREVWRIEQAREGTSERARLVWRQVSLAQRGSGARWPGCAQGFGSAAATTDAFRHGLAMIRV